MSIFPHNLYAVKERQKLIKCIFIYQYISLFLDVIEKMIIEVFTSLVMNLNFMITKSHEKKLIRSEQG